MLDIETLLRNCTPFTPGVFILHKSKFMSAEFGTDQSELCNNFSYTGVQVTEGTDYENQEVFVNRELGNQDTKYEIRTITKYAKVIDASPDFIIIYIEFKTNANNLSMKDIQKEQTPSLMWYGRSFFHLLKNMREWQYVNQNDIDANHPMGIYSHVALTKLNPSAELLSEIDGWPDMHLAKFFKGSELYKEIPTDFPEPSEAMKNWVVSISEQYKEKTFDEILDMI